MNNKISPLLGKLSTHLQELEPFIEQKITEINHHFSKEIKPLYSEKDIMLITYADQFKEKGKNNFAALNSFITQDLKNIVSVIHLLPFYPWTSDDGFSPIDYQQVCKDYGDWQDIENIQTQKMFDCVFNHMSSKSLFFQKALSGDEQAKAMFHIVNEEEYNAKKFQQNIKKVVRPRTSSLFTPYHINGNTHYVWTTFSDDQVDTNLDNLEMCKYLLETFFFYIEKGARYFRIDAVPFMWKELGTNCSHHPKTHIFIQLLRAIVEKIHLNLYLVTESNVPHHENIAYWGNGENEAHIIYNFSLAPLILHGLTFETNQYLHTWAKEVFTNHQQTTYLNFTASHDGIGMRGLEGIVPEEDIQRLCTITESKGGIVGKKQSRDGTVRPYELNITWSSFLKQENEDKETFIRKVVNSHAIVMFFPGIGAHYAHNFLGTLNWHEGHEESGIPRRLNRKKLDYPIAYDETSERIKNELLSLIEYRTSHKVFSPLAKIQMLDINEKCLAFSRELDGQQVSVYFNLSSDTLKLDDFKLAPYELRFL